MSPALSVEQLSRELMRVLRVHDQPALVWLDPLELAADGHGVTRARAAPS